MSDAPQSSPWVPSKHQPGLFVSRQGVNITFGYNEGFETFSARTGQMVDFGGAEFPPNIARYVRERVSELLPGHRRQLLANKKAAPTANQRAASDSQSPQEEPNAPIVGAPEPPVKEENTPAMPIDFSNPAAVKAASAVALRIKAALGIPELEERRTQLRAKNRDVELAYRNAQLDVSQAKRTIADAEEALKAREQELLLAAIEEKGDDGKKKYTVDGAKGAATAARKTDEEYIALTAGYHQAVQTHYEAERVLAEAEAEQKALVREFDLLRADLELATARVNAFSGLDADVVAQQPAA